MPPKSKLLMPIHDWSDVDPNLWHDFHQTWTFYIANALNQGLLPAGYSALIDLPAGLHATRHRSKNNSLASRANRISIRRPIDRVVAAIVIVSPGNKDSPAALHRFVEKVIEILSAGVSLVIVDLFPPSVRDPQGIHKVIWDEIEELPFELPPDKPMTLATYVASEVKTAYVRPIGHNDALPDMPAWLGEDSYVPVPLGATYRAAWASCPKVMREVVEH